MTHQSPDQPETFVIGGMSCAACAARIERSLRSLPGVHAANVNFATSAASVSVDRTLLSRQGIAARIQSLGFTTVEKADDKAHQGDFKLAMFTSALALPVAVLGMSHGAMGVIPHTASNFIQLTLSTIVMAIAWREFGNRAIRAAKHFSADMNTLVFLGVSAAFLTSVVSMATASPEANVNVYFEASCVTTAFVLIGRAIEGRARRATGDAVREILSAQPQTARREIDGQTISIDELVPGDRVIVHKGDRFPADCTITSGIAIVDESAMTGESLLLERALGAEVLGGCINHGETVVAEVSGDPKKSYLQTLAASVERLQSEKSPLSRTADRISGILAPTVIAISIGTFVTWCWIAARDWRIAAEFAASVLVVACPCALGLATPAAIATAAGTLAKRGVLFRDPTAIETCAKVNHVAFDKTGTLTTGKPKVLAVRIHEDADEMDVCNFLSIASRASGHPLAQALAQSLSESGMVSTWTESPGRGVIGTVNGKPVMLGSQSLLTEHSVNVHEVSHPGPTVLLSIENRHVASVLFVESLRDSAPPALKQLTALGIDTSILSGDRDESVRTIANELQCSNFSGQLRPADKVNEITRLKHTHQVAFVGDGLNDAPALAAAELGISMMGSTSAATATAGMSLATADLTLIPQAIHFAKRTVATIKANLIWAFAYNAISLPLAAGALVPINGWKLNPMIASAAMALSSISVVLNSLRLRNFFPLRND